MTPAVSYLRMSKEIQDTSIASQRTAVATLAKSMGFKIIREYVDSGISGDATEKRAAFLKMLADSAVGDFKVILCWDQDRFGRFDLMEAGFWIKPLRDNGVRLVTVAQGAIDWEDFAGRLIYSIQQEAKHQFLRDLSRNSSRGKMEAAKLGKWMGGAAPYGYDIGPDKHLVPHPEEALIIKEIFDRYGRGESMRKICISFTERGIASPDNVKWNAHGIGRIVRSQVYLGHLSFNKKSTGKYNAILNGMIVPRTTSKEVRNASSLWMIVKNAHAPLVSQDVFDKAQETLKINKRFSGPATTFRVMFRSLLKCGWCGSRMSGYFVPRLNDTCYSCATFSNHDQCVSNRTYQKPLMAEIKKILRSQYLTSKGVAAAKVDLLGELDIPARSTPRSVLASRVTSLKAKLSKAEIRLTEVPVDMVNVVADQIRELREQLLEAESNLEVADRPKRDMKSEVSKFIDEKVRLFREILNANDPEPSQSQADLLRASFESITIWSENPGPYFNESGKWQPNGRWAIKKVQVKLKLPEFSQ